jgi:hypothetical protein
MTITQDTWYVRLPNGRVVRARSTAALRYHMKKGRIPLTSRVRRPDTETWTPLTEVRELAPPQPAAPPASQGNGRTTTTAPRRRSRTDARAWSALGVRGLVRELLYAFDSSLHRTKLGIACLIGVLASGVWILWPFLNVTLEGLAWWAGVAGLAAVTLLLATLAMSLVTQVTSIELARLRAPRAGELWPSALWHAGRLAIALVLVVGLAAALVLALRWLPDWLWEQATAEAVWWPYAAAAALIVRMILEVLFWPVLALAPLLLSPILVVEDCSVLEGLGEWWRLLRKHLGRIFLYEALAAALACVFTVPLLIPIALAWNSLEALPDMQLLVGQATLFVLGGIALTPLVAYLLVANVFIYLNLRYQFFQSARR